MTNITKLYNIEPMDCTVLFSCTESVDDLIRTVQKNKKMRQFLTEREAMKELLEMDEDCDGFVISHEKTEKPAIIFVRNRKRKGWYFYEVLLHETNHLVYFLSKYYGFDQETEYQATLHEGLFRNFRRLLAAK